MLRQPIRNKPPPRKHTCGEHNKGMHNALRPTRAILRLGDSVPQSVIAFHGQQLLVGTIDIGSSLWRPTSWHPRAAVASAQRCREIGGHWGMPIPLMWPHPAFPAAKRMELSTVGARYFSAAARSAAPPTVLRLLSARMTILLSTASVDTDPAKKNCALATGPGVWRGERSRVGV